MILIIGGIAQGKAAYAESHFQNAEAHTVRLNETARQWYDRGEDPLAQAEALLEADPDCIFLSEEIGNGLVPADPEERAFREWMGRLQVSLAARAEEVIRVTCGIGQVLKIRG